jgi:hypothetical protein
MSCRAVNCARISGFDSRAEQRAAQFTEYIRLNCYAVYVRIAPMQIRHACSSRSKCTKARLCIIGSRHILIRDVHIYRHVDACQTRTIDPVSISLNRMAGKIRKLSLMFCCIHRKPAHWVNSTVRLWRRGDDCQSVRLWCRLAVKLYADKTLAFIILDYRLYPLERRTISKAA